MSEYVMMTDSSCDLPAKLAEELELEVVRLTVSMEGKEYANYLDGREIDFKVFYDKLRSGSLAETSAVNSWTFKEQMEPFLKEGKDVLYLAFSSGLSATCSAGQVAAKELKEQYPDRKIIVVDTLCASLGQGLLVYLAVQEKRKGKSIEEVAKWAEDNRKKLCHWFTVDDLDHLKRGGRISSGTALIGGLLRIKPVLHVDNDGKLVQVSVSKGRKASLKALVKHMAETAINPQDQTVFISHGDTPEDANTVADLIKEKLGVKKEILINYVGPVIGAHSGAGTIALFFLGKER